MNLYWNKNNAWRFVALFIICIVILFAFAPFAHAADPVPASQQDARISACSEWGILLGWTFECAGANLIISILSGFVSALGYILYAIDALFNFVLNQTVLQFGNLYGFVAEPLNTLWSVARDLANILIIGLFIYIAISFILGLEQFGQKKYVARVLIIAVLINFSFLFTRMIINTSNALAIGI